VKLKETLQLNKDAYAKLMTQTRTNLGNLNKEKDELKRARSDVEKQLQDATTAHASQLAALNQRIEAIEAEKAAVQGQDRTQEEAISTAVAQAVAKVKEEAAAAAGSSVSRSDVDALNERHAGELKALESRLAEQHATELKAAVLSAASEATAKSSDAIQAPAPEPSSESIEAAVETRLAEEKAKLEQEKATIRATVEEELGAKHAQAIQEAKASVARELEAKNKVKDAKLARLQAQLVAIEQKNAAIEQKHPANTAKGVTSAGPPAPAVAAAKPTISSLPAKPGTAGGPGPSNPATRGTPVRGRGGVGRGMPGRGGAHILASVNATASGTSTTPATPTSPQQTSIIGAAAGAAGGIKRPRESETEGAQGDGKRIRGGGPTMINRTRLAPQTPPPQKPPGPA
jgi:hypothetical protein